MSSSTRDPRAQALLASLSQTWKKLESYLFRLPVLTRVVMLLIAVFHFLTIFGVPMAEYFALDPAKMDLGQSTTFSPEGMMQYQEDSMDVWTDRGLISVLGELNSASIEHISAHSYWLAPRNNESGCAYTTVGEIRKGDWNIKDAVACART